jgi:hypothetical protein
MKKKVDKYLQYWVNRQIEEWFVVYKISYPDGKQKFWSDLYGWFEPSIDKSPTLLSEEAVHSIDYVARITWEQYKSNFPWNPNDFVEIKDE